MKTPKKRRMGIYIILENLENLESQMGIYIFIYIFFMKIVIEKGTWGGVFWTNLAQFLRETSQKLKISLSLPEISWTFFLKNFREKKFRQKISNLDFSEKKSIFSQNLKMSIFWIWGFFDFFRTTFFVLIEKISKT